MQTATDQQRFCGREFTTEEVSLIQEVVETCAGISQLELAHTLCELLEWKCPGGGLKARECRDLLERFERQGVLALPDKKSCGSSNPRKLIAPAEEVQFHSKLILQASVFFSSCATRSASGFFCFSFRPRFLGAMA